MRLGAIAAGLLVCSSCIKPREIDPKSQLKIDTASIGPFIRASDPNAIKISSGVWYSIQKMDTGIFPVLSDSVKISYSVWPISNQTGIDTLLRLDTATLAKPKSLSTVIAGLQIGLLRFPVGSRGKIYIPSGLAFGTVGNGPIPPNTNLLYKITLTSAKGTRFTTDTTALNSYINSLIVSDVADSTLLKNRVYKDVSGIRYVYDTLYGNRQSNPELYPTLASNIEVDYKRAIINSKLDTLEVTSGTVALKDQITAWKIILPKISVGTTLLMFVPSGYGYGSSPIDSSIPANSNLVYKMTLKKIL